MIAFIKPPEESAASPARQHAHRLLAATLLCPPSGYSDSAPPLVAWKAWLFVGWLAVAAVWGLVHAVNILL
jgi:hypothetical protein